MTRYNDRPFTTPALFRLLKRVLPEHVMLSLFGRRMTVPVEARRRRR